ncbi:MAG: hypothetical protein AB7E48_10735 [Deferribacterales bacterium]
MSAVKKTETAENVCDFFDEDEFCAVEGHIGFDSVKAAQEKKAEIEDKMLTISVG